MICAHYTETLFHAGVSAPLKHDLQSSHSLEKDAVFTSVNKANLRHSSCLLTHYSVLFCTFVWIWSILYEDPLWILTPLFLKGEDASFSQWHTAPALCDRPLLNLLALMNSASISTRLKSFKRHTWFIHLYIIIFLSSSIIPKPEFLSWALMLSVNKRSVLMPFEWM